MTHDNFTTASHELLQNAAQLALQTQTTPLRPLHILSAALENEFCLSYFNTTDVPIHELAQLIKQEVALLPRCELIKFL